VSLKTMKTTIHARSARSERGIAMVLALFLMSALSVLAASMMFLSQTETYATMNYRMMSQARYAAEAGIHKVSNFLLDGTQYTAPGPLNANDPLTNYNRNVSPVTCANAAVCTVNQPIVLSALSGVSSNYPSTATLPSTGATVLTAFAGAGTGSLTAGTATLNYGTYATLLSMEVFDSYGGSQQVVQTWEVTSSGSIVQGRPATVQVAGLIETPKVPANSYAAFATSNQCGALTFDGNVDIDSYDSSQGTYAATVNDASGNPVLGGSVGTNGNLTVGGNAVDILGNLYSPKEGVGSCSNNGNVTALDGKAGTIAGSVVKLPTVISYPTPTFSPMPPTTTPSTVTTANVNGATAGTAASNICGPLGLTFGVTTGVSPTGNCDLRNAAGQYLSAGATGPFTSIVVNAGNGFASDITMPNVVVPSGVAMVFVGHSTPSANINMNSLTGAGSVEIEANMTGNNNEAVVLRIAGKNPTGVTSTLPDPTDMAVPFDFGSMSWKQNSTIAQSRLDASSFQLVYPGTGTLNLTGGNSQSAGVIYAPNASFELQGTQDWYGSVLAKKIWNHGNPKIHYDRRLSRDFWVAGTPMAGTFTWKRAS